MATKPDIATNLANRNLILENKRKHEGLRNQERAITSRPRTLKLTLRNKYIVVNQKRINTRFRTGFVPVRSNNFKHLVSPPISLLPRRRSRPFRLQNSRLAPLSQRTFRKGAKVRSGRSRTIPSAPAGTLKIKPAIKFKHSMKERVLKTTNLWLPGLRTNDVTQQELDRPFLRPLNAIDHLFNNQILEPTTAYFNGFKGYFNTKVETPVPSNEPKIYKSNQIIELLESEGGDKKHQPLGKTEGNSKRQLQNQNEVSKDATAQKEPKAKVLPSKEEHEEGRFSFERVSHVGVYAKLLAKRLRNSRFGGRRNSVNQTEINVVNSPTIDTLKALKRDKAPLVLLSACLSFHFGPPIKPFSPAKSGPQLIMSPLLTLNFSNLLLSPGKEVYLAETIDIFNLESERQKRVLRIRFAFKNGSKIDLSKEVNAADSFQTSAEVVQGNTFLPTSCILENDPDLKTYMLPLDSGQTLHSPLSKSNAIDENPKGDESFTEFGYQVLNTGVGLDG